MSLVSLTLVLFLIMDPLGNAQGFANIVKNLDPQRQRFIIRREMFIALAFILASSLLGECIFGILGISQTSIYLASALILFLSAIKILFPSSDSPPLKKTHEEPFLVPLAVPMIAGPSMLATVMLYSSSEPSVPLMLIAIFLAWSISGTILLYSNVLVRLIGSNGLMAIERLMGMVLVLISIQRFLEGIILFKNNLSSISY